jgi:hypothetical protein
MMSADLKIAHILHSQILHFLIFVYIKAKTLQPKPKTILAMLYLVPMTLLFYHVNQNPEVPLMKSLFSHSIICFMRFTI